MEQSCQFIQAVYTCNPDTWDAEELYGKKFEASLEHWTDFQDRLTVISYSFAVSKAVKKNVQSWELLVR